MEKVIRRVTFEEAEQLDREFWATKTIPEKWEILTQMRRQFNGENARLIKVISVVRHDR
jgi:hypothetical protein